mgnify:FL=1
MAGEIEHIRGKGFDKNPQNINRNGRPKTTITLIMEQLKLEWYERVSRSQIIETYEVLLWLPEETLRKIVNDKSYAMMLRIVAKKMISNKGDEMLEKMLDRAHGKATQREETSMKVEWLGFVLSDEKQRTIDRMIEKKLWKEKEKRNKK